MPLLTELEKFNRGFSTNISPHTGLLNAADGTSAANYEYGPFGEVIRAAGPMAKANPFLFSTKYSDDESDLLYYGYRYYNASTGRWLIRDPIGERGGRNIVAFSENDFLDRIDINGLESADLVEEVAEATAQLTTWRITTKQTINRTFDVKCPEGSVRTKIKIRKVTKSRKRKNNIGIGLVVHFHRF